MPFEVICSVPGGTGSDASAEICDGFLRVLRQSYPGYDFTPATRTTGGPALEVQITQASRTGTGIRLIWTDAAGRRHEGEVQAVSAMDRNVTPSMQISLYHRALTATPMPDHDPTKGGQ
ncbi:hypothetical protein [Pseudogemmobacter humi]|uniref:Uncharacterized protein n=1 Tax=Pseudogemmobacter humi TaxID=2483812 RepID=A0A3P5XEM9_9RHOB|nr:hypothetical protein [Pseudogemmobacter humi]VDC33194.1 hypothetical protein XINFAN_03696 [Pseudogemmobacter humi]